MNILIPHQWLLEHLDTQATPQQIQEYLSLSGPSVERIYNIQGDQVYDIEITTNRVDSMSVRGVAREAAVILNRFGIKAKLKPLELPNQLSSELKPTTDQTLPLPEIESSPELANRILTVILKDVQAKAAPNWMTTRLEQIGVNVHHNLIDITNYITHDLGHPCHAFDYDKIMELGGKIKVKQAEPGKEFTTLDKEKHETVGGEIVFENPQGEIIDLPAVKGTLNTGVTEQTKNVLLWIENLEAQHVRHASMSHAIRTVAAQLNEKGVDPYLGLEVILKGVELYQNLAEAEIGSQLYDQFPNKPQIKPVVVELATIDNYLGLRLDRQEIVQILEQLGCRVELIQSRNSTRIEDNQEESREQTKQTGPSLKVQPPTFRPDLKIPADIVEEIARIYGYHQLPSKLMATAIPTKKPKNVDFEIENRVKHYLANIGWQEVYTYSMVSQELALQSGFELNKHLAIANPLTEDRVYLRRSLLPSLEEAIQANPNVQQLSVFELANVYHPRENQIPEHEMRIALVSNKDYRQVRGDLEGLLGQFYLDQIEVTPQGEIRIKPEKIKLEKKGREFQDKLQNELQGGQSQKTIGHIKALSNKRIGISLSYQTLLETARKYPYYKPQPKTSPIIEDLTFTLPQNQPVGPVITQLKLADQLVSAVELTDIYQQNYTFQVKYWDKEENLTTEDVKPIRQKLVKQIEDQFRAELVGGIS
ncbi:MAG: hypothetical protein GF381_04055 [Candidatus Pacebacteria bacterium]|nr:hypothetical protein [Candidatus Paceibacterota bacterium]